MLGSFTPPSLQHLDKTGIFPEADETAGRKLPARKTPSNYFGVLPSDFYPQLALQHVGNHLKTLPILLLLQRLPEFQGIGHKLAGLPQNLQALVLCLHEHQKRHSGHLANLQLLAQLLGKACHQKHREPALGALLLHYRWSNGTAFIDAGHLSSGVRFQGLLGECLALLCGGRQATRQELLPLSCTCPACCGRRALELLRTCVPVYYCLRFFGRSLCQNILIRKRCKRRQVRLNSAAHLVRVNARF
mmetsp:Transcript_94752/g.173674  ORF Transcript_94752/g.173674 Transcript_94752/m.173674 type:complete len:246 (+) Transcript_94752:841-1578(+)